MGDVRDILGIAAKGTCISMSRYAVSFRVLFYLSAFCSVAPVMCMASLFVLFSAEFLLCCLNYYIPENRCLCEGAFRTRSPFSMRQRVGVRSCLCSVFAYSLTNSMCFILLLLFGMYVYIRCLDAIVPHLSVYRKWWQEVQIRQPVSVEGEKATENE